MISLDVDVINQRQDVSSAHADRGTYTVSLCRIYTAIPYGFALSNLYSDLLQMPSANPIPMSELRNEAQSSILFLSLLYLT
jgi:hypothetical protein